MKLKTSYEEFSREFIKFLLRDNDSSEISKKMGYKFNIVRRWILGTRIIKWKEFVQFSDVLGLETNKFLTTSIAFICVDQKEREQVFRFLRNQWSQVNTAKLAKILATDVTVLNKYINGTRPPSLSIVLKLLNQRKGNFEAFIIEFTQGRKHPWQYLTDPYHREVDVFKYHGTDAVFACLALNDYQSLAEHSAEFIAQKVKISVAHVNKIISLLEQHKVIAWRNGKYECLVNHISTSGATIEQLKSNHIYWQKRSIEMLENHKSGPLHKGEFSTFQTHTVFHVSREALQKVYSVIKSCNSEIINILENENPPPYVDVRVFITSFLSTSDFESPIPRHDLKTKNTQK